MNNPIPPAIRFLQNFPGVCQRAAIDIDRAIQSGNRSDVAINMMTSMVSIPFAACFGGIAVVGAPELSELMKVPDTVSEAVMDVAGTALIALSGVEAVGLGCLVAISLNNLRKAGKELRPTPVP
jgi:hypothetical protein